MPEPSELILSLRIAQLENKLLLYESVLQDISSIGNLQAVSKTIKHRLATVLDTWQNCDCRKEQT